MSDEAKNETEENVEETDAPAADAPAETADEDAPAAEEEAPAADEEGEAPTADDEEAPAADEQEAAEPAAAPASDEEAGAPTPKQLRKAARSRATGPPAEPRPPAERATQRAERRRARAQSRRRYRASERGQGAGGEGTPPAERRPGPRKVRQGTVVSSKADKTITVRFEVARRHPVYEKVVRRTATLHAHDEANDANEGDVVRVVESRPLSRTKRWRLTEILERAR